MRWLTYFVFAIALSGAANAADLTVRVQTSDGAPVPDAVVTYHPDGGAPKGPIKFDWVYRVEQRNIQFSPRTLIVPVGATVAFPNLDKVRHHVYSFSAGNRFELKLYGRDETQSYTFKTTGIAAIGCNIHDQMSAYIVIVDTPYAAMTDAKGRAVLRGASGSGEVRVWRQDVRAPGNRYAQKLKASESSSTITLELKPGSAAAPSHAH